MATKKKTRMKDVMLGIASEIKNNGVKIITEEMVKECGFTAKEVAELATQCFGEIDKAKKLKSQLKAEKAKNASLQEDRNDWVENCDNWVYRSLDGILHLIEKDCEMQKRVRLMEQIVKAHEEFEELSD